MECSMMILFFAVFVFCALIGWGVPRIALFLLALMFLLCLLAGILGDSTWFLLAGMLVIVFLLTYDGSDVS